MQPLSWWKLARNLLLIAALALVLIGIGLVVGRSRTTPGADTEVLGAIDNYGCLVCHGNPDYQPRESGRPWDELYIDETVLSSSIHSSVKCTGCHVTFDTGEPIEGQAVQALCGNCHAREQALQEGSVHADPEVATCPDCHAPSGSGHDVPAVLSLDSPVSLKNTAETCGDCHSDTELMARYELNPSIHDIYLDSPHGKVLKLTGPDLDGMQPATCSTCHGNHEVLAVDDPESPVGSAANLAALCATCHHGANENFASTLAEHDELASEELSPPAFYGERFFFVLTSGVVGLGLLMVGMEGFGWLSGRVRGRGPDDRDGPGGSAAGGDASGPPPAGDPGSGTLGAAMALPGSALAAGARGVPRSQAAVAVDSAPRAGTRAVPEVIVRFDAHQRIQHILMMGSFLALAFTGLPQKFPDWEISQALIGMMGGLDAVRTVHRFAGLLMITNCLYHLGYVGYGTAVLKRPLPVWMIPTPKDAFDFFQDLQFWFGRSSEKPRFGRFSYREKFDYWAIFWGVPVMAISGLVLMFPVLAAKVLPGDAVSVAMVAHSDEAMLAVLWIFIVHLFFVHLNPQFFPLNGAIFTGKMPRPLYAEEHPLELAAMERSQAAPGPLPPPPPEGPGPEPESA